MNKPKRSRSRVASDESALCQFSFADGRTCRMFRQPDHPSLCIFHARAERQIVESDRLGSELAATLTGKFMTATDINFALGKLYQAIAQNRVPPRIASNLAFVGKLLLLSLHSLKDEFKFKYEFEQWIEMERASRSLSSPPSLSPPGQQSTAVSSALRGDQAPAVTEEGAAAVGPGQESAGDPS